MANVDTFPLLKLPYLPLANVIQQFDSILTRVRLAALSRRTALLVKSLRDINVLGLNLTVSKSLKFSLIYLDQGRILRQVWMHTPDPNTLDSSPLLVGYKRLRKLIDTMFFIFGLSGFEELVIKWKEDTTMKMSGLQNLLRNLNTIKFERIYSSGFYNQVLAAFPSVRNVSMMGKPKNQLLTKDLNILKLSLPNFYGLDLVNSESLQLMFLTVMEKELNEYLMVWIQGGMPRLKHMCAQYLVPVRQDLIFEGIEYREADQNREKTFKSYSLKLGDPETTVVQGGVDIKSKYGTRATITTQNKENGYLSWNMNVWD